MLYEAILTRKIYMEPKCLSKDIYSFLEQKLSAYFESYKCSMEYGCILSINDIIRYKKNTISRNADCIIFDVTFKGTFIKPCVGEKVQAVIHCINKNYGLFLKYYCIDIIVPFSDISVEKTVGEEVNIEITAVNYDNHIFKCIAKLI